MTAWDPLRTELDRWGEEGRAATFWWRDDDAVEPTPALDRLLETAAEGSAPLALAVIPARASGELAARLAEEPGVSVLQHGWAHANHAPSGGKKCELGAERDAETVLGELSEGYRRLAGFPRFRPCLVPPWNRIDGGLLAGLPGIGLTALSTFNARRSPAPVPGLRQVNVHADPIDWRGTRGFVGLEAAVAQVVGHLAARRSDAADAAEPTGLLTHHLVHDADTWTFVRDFSQIVSAHPAARWLDAERLLHV